MNSKRVGFRPFTIALFAIFGYSGIPSSLASFCGNSGVPYSFEVLQNGAPVLGCAQPTCLMTADEQGGEAKDDSQFLTDANGQADGFFRDGDRSLKRYRHSQAPKLVANCSGQFNELSCPRKNQWVGGIEYIDHPRQPLILQCCTFDGLRFSQEVGTTTVGPGEAITGGEVIRNGRQISFDVIANVKKIAKHDGGSSRVQYEVTVRRMNCLPDPPEPEVEVDADVPAEVLRVLSSAKGKDVADETSAFVKQSSKELQQPQVNQRDVSLTEVSATTNEKAVVETVTQQPTQQQQQQPNNPNQVQPILPGGVGSSQGIPPPGGPALPQLPNNPPPPPFQNALNPAPSENAVFPGQPQQPQAPGGPPPPSPFSPFVVAPQPPQQQHQQQQIGLEPASTIAPPLPFSVVTFPTLPPIPGLPTLPPAPPPMPDMFTLPPPPGQAPSAPGAGFTIPTLPPHQQPRFDQMQQAGSGGNNRPGAMTPQGYYMEMAKQYQAMNVRHSAPVSGPVYNNVPIMYPHIPPNQQPAAGTIMSQFKDSYYPIVHPVFGLMGYSNAPVHPITFQRMDGRRKK